MNEIDKDQKKSIHTIVTALIQRMGFEATLEVLDDQLTPGGFVCQVTVGEGQNFLIGQYGMNLAALQHLTRILVRKEVGEKLDIIVDINGSFSEKRVLVEKEAKQAVDEALQKNASVALRPMLSYERKIVHSFLANNGSVLTESVGVGEERKVMIRPKPPVSE